VKKVLLILVGWLVVKSVAWLFEIIRRVNVKITVFWDVPKGTNVSEQYTAYIFKAEDRLLLQQSVRNSSVL
jgi:hypothetical protein